MSNFSFNPLAWAIRPLYQQAIAEDALFAKQVREKEARTDKPKSLAECADYILGEAYHWASEHRDGNVGFSGLPDEEMVNLIKHYYDEENIEIRKVGNAKASVATSKETKKADAKKTEPKKTASVPKVVKLDFQKETLSAGLTPMTRPTSERKAKQVSKAQAESVAVYDMFAGMWDEEPKKEEPKPTPTDQLEDDELEDVEVVDVPTEDDDDLPL